MAKKAERNFITLNNWSVENVRKLDFGIFFTLKVIGAAFYNLRVVPAGRTYEAFIACPEEKGRDGKYYKLFNLYISPEDSAEIIAEVLKAAKK